MSNLPPPPAFNNSVPSAPKNGMGLAALILGIAGLPFAFFCGLGIVASILAIIFGWLGMKKAASGEANNRGVALAGLILGIVGVALMVVGLIVFGAVNLTSNR